MSTSVVRSVAALVIAVACVASTSHPRTQSPGPALAADASSRDAAATSLEHTSSYAPFDPARLAPSLSRLESEWIGSARGYECRFDDRGFSFVPVLGPAGDPAQRMRLELYEVRLGADTLWSRAARAPAPWQRASTAPPETPRIEREIGASWRERVELRGDGVELSFALAHAPRGSGELTLRYACESGLGAPHALSDAELLFGTETAGIRIAGVFGVDAHGRRWNGRASATSDAIELTLDADCVANAAYPLVLDPLITSSTDVLAGTTSSDGEPDIAYREGVGYLAVWKRSVNLAQSSLLGARLDANGGVVGGAFSIAAPAGALVQAPAVAAVAQSNRFLVAWEQREGPFSAPDLRACSVDAASQSASASIALAAGSEAQAEPDVGGAVSGGGAWVAWSVDAASAVSSIRLRALALGAGGVPSFASNELTLETGAACARPSISKGVDGAGRALVVWEAADAAGRDIHAALVGGTGVVIAAQNVTNDAQRDDAAPDVDGAGPAATGGGDVFLVAWQSTQAGSPSHIRCNTAQVDGALLTVQPSAAVDIAASATSSDRAPAIGFSGGKHLVAWVRDTGGFNAELRLIGLDDTDCDVCDVQSVIAGSSANAAIDRVEIASTHSGGSVNDQRAIAIRGAFSTQLPFDADVKATVWTAFGAGQPLGPPTPGFGVCGLPGGTLALVQPAVLGNDDFAVAMPALPVPALHVLLIAFEELSGDPPMPSTPVFAPPGCAPCMLHFNPATSFLVAATSVTPPTFAIPLPCDAAFSGQRFFLRGLYLSTLGVPPEPCEFQGLRLDATREAALTLGY